MSVKSANVLLDTPQSLFPPLAFVKEFKGQIGNLMSEAEVNEKTGTKLFELAPEKTRRSRIRTMTVMKSKPQTKNKRIPLVS
ncbi:MAG: hypothetical protein GEU26_06535 [Nitrososphaeraceae archaeon]|nr:hypothetical protein [Nitrososphaeraceae archaeon]